MLKKMKGKMKRRNTEPTMAMGQQPVSSLALSVPPNEEDNNDSSTNNTDF